MDIDPILRYWLQIADKMHVRRIKVHQKRVQIQIDIDNVIFCYLSASGHPNGFRPYHYKSFLSYFQAKWGKQSYLLSSDDQMKLKQEVISYFSRGLAYFKLAEYHAAAMDARHGIEAIRFTTSHCSSEQSAWLFEKLLPKFYFLYYLALTCMSLEQGKMQSALRYLTKGEDIIRACYEKTIRRGEKIMAGEVRRLLAFKGKIMTWLHLMESAEWKTIILQNPQAPDTMKKSVMDWAFFSHDWCEN